MARLALDEHDVAELQALLTLTGSDPDLGLPWEFLHQLKRVLGCDVLFLTGIDVTQRKTRFHQLPHDEGDSGVYDDAEACAVSLGPADEDPFWIHFGISDACNYPQRTGDFRSVTLLSDFYSSRQWHAHPFHVDYFAGLGDGFEHELMMNLRDGIDGDVRLLCFRGSGSDFGERERFLLTLLRPHIAEAYRAARRHQAAAALTPRQLEVLGLVREGLTNRQVGRRLGMSEATVRTHLTNAYARLDVTSRTAAVALALPDRGYD